MFRTNDPAEDTDAGGAGPATPDIQVGGDADLMADLTADMPGTAEATTAVYVPSFAAPKPREAAAVVPDMDDSLFRPPSGTAIPASTRVSGYELAGYAPLAEPPASAARGAEQNADNPREQAVPPLPVAPPPVIAEGSRSNRAALTLGVMFLVLLVGAMVGAYMTFRPTTPLPAPSPTAATLKPSVTAGPIAAPTSAPPSAPSTFTPPTGAVGTTIAPSVNQPTVLSLNFPPAGSTSCGDSVSVGANTSCAFAANVAAAVPAGAGTTFSVVAASPTTGQTYTMTCTRDAYITCTGGSDATVYVR